MVKIFNKTLVSLCALLLTVATALAVVDPTGTTHTQSTMTQCADGLYWTFCAPGNEPGGNPGTDQARLAFSDIESGPDTGLGDGLGSGVVVTVWGHELGDTQGSSTIEYCDSTGTCREGHVYYWKNADGSSPGAPANLYATHGLQEIAMSIPDSAAGAGTIRTTVQGTQSELPFTVTTGNIYHVDITASGTGTGTHSDPYSNPGTALNARAAGDTIYFNTGTYDSTYLGGGEIIWVRPGSAAGTASQPITFSAMPGERPFFENLSAMNSSFHTGIRIDEPYYNISKIDFESYASGVIASAEGVRVVGNDLDGGNVFRSGIGVITGARNDVEILGNSVHGGETGNRLDHAIYLTGCAPDIGNVVAYNNVYNNNFGSGPMIVVNHESTRCADDVSLASHYIYNNYVDCTTYRSRAIGIFDQSWDPGTDTGGEPDPTYVYNNVTMNCGDDGEPVAYQNAAKAVWYNNTFYNMRNEVSSGLSINGTRVISTDVRNNIFHKVTNSGPYFSISAPTTTINKNLYFGDGNGPTEDANAINADPLIELNSSGFPVKINAASPAASAGDDGVLSTTTIDYYNTDRASVVDVGAIKP
jgi:hypothetical protein